MPGTPHAVSLLKRARAGPAQAASQSGAFANRLVDLRVRHRHSPQLIAMLGKAALI